MGKERLHGGLRDLRKEKLTPAAWKGKWEGCSAECLERPWILWLWQTAISSTNHGWSLKGRRVPTLCCIYENPTGFIKIKNIENAAEGCSEYILKKNLDLYYLTCPLIDWAACSLEYSCPTCSGPSFGLGYCFPWAASKGLITSPWKTADTHLPHEPLVFQRTAESCRASHPCLLFGQKNWPPHSQNIIVVARHCSSSYILPGWIPVSTELAEQVAITHQPCLRLLSRLDTQCL